MTVPPLTIGIEEEYLLLDPETGVPVAASARVRRIAARRDAVDPDVVDPELLEVQVEVASAPTVALEAAGQELATLRKELSAAAKQAGCRIVAVGAASRFADELPPTTDKERYQAMHDRAPRLVDEMLLNGMHVHIGIDDADERVAVLNGLRPWLPYLTALAANSPLWDGEDSGFASWRTIHFARWPISGPPPVFADAADYDARASVVFETGALVDAGQLYWQARLSQRYPTVEVRVADVQLTLDEALFVAATIRAAAHSVLEVVRAGGAPGVEVSDELLRAAVWQAARDEFGAALLDPSTGRSRPAAEVVATAEAMLAPALAVYGDADRVERARRRRDEVGSGAARQRRRFAEAGRTGLLELLVDEYRR
jgi:carboxylate-amine ligase